MKFKIDPDYINSGIYVKERDIHLFPERRPDRVLITDSHIITAIEHKSDQDDDKTFLGRDQIMEGQYLNYPKYAHYVELWAGSRWLSRFYDVFKDKINESWTIFEVYGQNYPKHKMIRQAEMMNDLPKKVDEFRLAMELSHKLYYSNN